MLLKVDQGTIDQLAALTLPLISPSYSPHSHSHQPPEEKADLTPPHGHHHSIILQALSSFQSDLPVSSLAFYKSNTFKI